jgi:hypothetical protein
VALVVAVDRDRCVSSAVGTDRAKARHQRDFS